MLEQLGTFLKSEEQRNLFRSDFSRMKNIVKAFRSEGQTSHSFLPDEPININTPIVDQDLFHQQIAQAVFCRNTLTLPFESWPSHT